jgi:predicted NUDIX family NTP pyrophosphohydrolase
MARRRPARAGVAGVRAARAAPRDGWAPSAGLLLYRRDPVGGVEVLLAHRGGPFWVKRDEGGWSIPKGEYEQGEDPLAAARREFAEGLGKPAPDGQLVSLGEVRQPSGKRIAAWAIEADLDVTSIQSNAFELEWPRGSARLQEFPEVDRADWLDIRTARAKLVSGQVPFLDLLLERLGGGT